MKTVKELIAELEKIEDKEQPVLSYYWLHNDFEFMDFGEEAEEEEELGFYVATREQFRELDARPYVSSIDWGYEQLSNQISDTLHEIIRQK